MSAALEVSDVTVRYGGVIACNRVSIRVDAGEVVGLIGPNGAGKTSLVDGITGFARIGGRVVVDGTPVPERAQPHEIARLGLTRTFQTLELFDDLTVRDNMLVAQGGGDDSPRSVSVDGVLELLELLPYHDLMVGDCSHGVRQVVSFGRALVANSPVLLLDEPAAGLDRVSRDKLAAVIKDCARSGRAILVIDHDLELVMELCDRIYVLDMGELIASGTPAELRRNEQVLSAYMGMS